MSRTREYRRVKSALKKKKCSRYSVAGVWGPFTESQSDKRIVGKVAATPKACGCWMCANHRKVFGVPFSDVRRKARYTGGE